MKRPAAAAWVALSISYPWAAHAAGPVVPSPVAPGAGTILQEIKPVEPPPPSPSDSALTIDQRKSAALPPTAPFAVNAIRITGNAIFDTSTLHALIADAEGKELTLPELDARIARISDFYLAHGYPLARALIPAQTIRDGVVDVAVIEARYGRVVIDNHSRVSTTLLQRTLAPLQNGQVIEQKNLDHVLLLLGDTPGVTSSATLQPGSATGTSDLLIQGAPSPAISAQASLDNYGNRYTGGVRANGEIALYDPLQLGDVLDASVLSSGRDLNYGRLSYDILLNGYGTHMGASYSALHYLLGESLATLDGHGTADVTSAWGRQPVLRSRDVNLYAQLQFDRKELHDHIDASGIRTDRHLNNWTAGLSADWRDSLFSGGSNSASLQWTHGSVGFEDASAQRTDEQTARTRGPFSQWNATLARLQRLNADNEIYMTVSGQGADNNLDPAQKLVAGGRYTVRSYDMSAFSGDTGVQTSVELRHDLNRVWHGHWQALAFVDGEHVTVNKNVWTTGKNDATLRGAGLGLNWANSSRWSVKVYAATRLGAPPELVGSDSRIRAWAEISKGF